MRTNRKLSVRRGATKTHAAAQSVIEPLELRWMYTLLLAYNPSGYANGGGAAPALQAATTLDPSLTQSSSQDLSKGSTIGAISTANVYGGNTFNTSDGTEASAIANSKYFTFGFTVGASETESLSELDGIVYRSGSGPSSIALQYNTSANTTLTDIASFTSLNSAANTSTSANLSTVAGLQNLPAGTSVNFRYVPYNLASSANGGTFYFRNASGNAITLYGTAVAAKQTVALGTSTASVVEDTSSITITLNRGGANGTDFTGTLSVPYNTSDGTAVAGTNYTSTSGTAVFTSGVTSTTVTIPILNNQPQGGNKTFTFNLGTPTLTGDGAVTAGILGSATDTITIVDDQETFAFSNSNYSVNNNASGGTVVVDVTRSGYIGNSAMVNYATADGTALSGTNYSSTSGTLNFASNQSTAAITVPITNVNPQGGDKSFTLNLTSPSNTSGDYIPPTSIAPATVTIVDSGAVAFTNNLTGAPGAASNIETSGLYSTSYSTVVGSPSGTGSLAYQAYDVLTFNASNAPGLYPQIGQTVNSINNLSLSLYNSDNSGSHNGTPGDFNVYVISAPDSGATKTTTLKFNSSDPTGLNGANSPNGATTPLTYLGTFSFDDNAAYDTYSISSIPSAASSVITTALNTAGASFRLAVTPATGGATSIAADFVGIGVDPTEAPILSLSASVTQTTAVDKFSIGTTGYTVSPGGIATITVTRSFLAGTTTGATSSDAVSVAYNTTGGTAVSGLNFTPVSGILNFAAGQNTASFNVSTANISPQGGNKILTVNIGNAQASTNTLTSILNPSQTLTIVDPASTSDTSATAYSINAGYFTTTGYVATNTSNGTPYEQSFEDILGSSNSSTGSFSAIDFNTSPGSQDYISLNSGTAVSSINSLAFDGVNSSGFSGAVNGLLDVYLASNTSASLGSASTLKFNTSNSPQGVGSQLGQLKLLGQINFNIANSSTSYTQYPLLGASQQAENILINDINDGLPFRLVVAPDSSAVQAGFAGTSVFINTTATNPNGFASPAITINYNVTSTLPAWLQPGSVATWDPNAHTLVVTGPSTIIGDPGTDEPMITADGASAMLTIQPPARSAIHIGSLSLTNGASGSVVAPKNGTDTLVIGSGTSNLVIDATSKLDLGRNDMIIQGGSVSAINSLLTSGFANGAWTGPGIDSSVAASDSTYLTTLGSIANVAGSGALYSNFDGVASTSSDVLIKYTYYGDTNLDGQVDGSDYTKIDNGFNNALTGWANGNLNYDGAIDGSDYTLIDNVFNTQGSPITVSNAALVAAPTTKTTAATLVGKITTGKATAAIPVSTFSSTASLPTLTDLNKKDKAESLISALFASAK